MSHVLKEDRSVEGILQLLLDRPEKKNALDQHGYQALQTALEAADRDDSVRVVVLAGAGANFTSGNDLADFHGPDAPGAVPALRFLRTLSCFEKPIIAAVEGHAVGIGTTLLLHCDLAYAGRDARFLLPFINLALCPEGGSSYLLPLICGGKKAAELLLLGEAFSADVAMQAGLINDVTASGEALAQAVGRARQLAQKSPQALLATKRLLKRGDAAAVAESLKVEFAQFQVLLESDAAQQTLQAFFARDAAGKPAKPSVA